MSKKIASLFFAVAVATGSFLAHAEVVGEDAARAAAEGFLSKSSVAKTILAGRSVDSVEAYGNLWIVCLAPSGYIEVAGSTKCAPVISFSSYDFSEPEEGSPLADKLSADSLMVEKKEADESAVENADWAKYTAPVVAKRVLLGAASPGSATPVVGPILGATWNQTAPFNDLSPYNYFCGCMATAAGQELRYWRWPYRYEKFRQTTHGVRDAQFNYSDFVLRPNGLVPFNWDKVVASAPNPASTPWAADKEATYNTAWLSLWAQSLTGMGYKPGGSGGTKQLASTAEEYWYEKGTGMTYWNDGYTNLWNAIKADLEWGSPIQINTAAHQMVIDGYAVENEGQADEVDWINLNLGYGNAVYWDNLKTAVTEGTYSGVLASFQTGFRPQKIVQFEPVPKVCSNDVTLVWHMAPCYTNRTTGFTLEVAKAGGAANTIQIETHGETTTYTASGLEMGGEYTFSVCPVMVDGEGTGRTNSVTTTIGEPKAAPEFLNVSSVACGIELLQQDIFIECAYGITNKIDLTCSESTTDVVPYSSHLTILPDSQLSVTKNGSVFTVNVDATAMDPKWSGEMLVLTLVAKNEDGTEAYKNLMLRFNSMRQVINGTFDVAEGDSNSAVWFCGDTTIDAKGRAVSFGANAFQGTGKVTLIDSVGTGSFTFAGLDNFKGTLVFTGDCNVTLPSDMTKFEGTLSITSGTFTLSNDLSDSTKVIISEGVTVTLDNANVASTITGAGTISITSGSSVLSGSVTSGVALSDGELTIPAGKDPYSQVSVTGGTLKIKLSKAQSILGYDWWLPLYTSGSVKFVLYDGTIVDATTTAATPGIKIAHASDANVWTGENYALFGDKYSAKWSNGLPGEDEYVIINSALDDTDGTMMRLDLASERNLGYVYVKGVSKIEIGKYNTDTSALLTTDVLENDVETHITTTYFQPKTVIPHRTLSTSSGFVLSCELDSAYADNLKKHETGGSALPDANYWQGTVLFCNRNVNNLELPNYGNAQSKVRFNGATGSLRGDGTFAGTIELVDYGETPAINLSSGSSSYPLIIGSVVSNGMFKTSGSATSLNILLKDISGWTGSFDLASKTIAIGQAVPSSYTGTDGRLHICQAATVAADATWKAAGGLYLGADGALTVNGAVETKNITTYGAGASLTLEDGAALQVAAASASDQTPALNFKSGTFRVKEGSDAFRETSTINFCAASGKRTVIDANGATLTLGPNVFSGSGDVCLTSSKEGGKIIVEGVSAAYSGTIYCDISCEVSLGDLSMATNCTIDVSDIIVSRSSSDIGNFTIGAGASLEVTVSKAHLMSGLEIDSVTLVYGGTLVLRDKDGKELEYTTSDGKYILEADSSVTVECLLDYEFNGNMNSTGTDTTGLTIWNGTASYDSESQKLKMNCKPYISKTFAMPDDEWSTFIRCTLPVANGESPTMVLMFGKNGGSVFGLVAGAGENTVALANKDGLIGEAVQVDDATTKQHVYAIVKTANRVRLYVDGALKVDESATVSVSKEFQIGSVKNGNNTSYAACEDTNALIDYLKFYDFAVGENFEEMVYSGPKPIAVWMGDFNTKFDGCTLNWHDNSFADDVITIEDGYQGVDVNFASGTNAITVIVKYTNLVYSASNDRVFFTSCTESTKTYDRTAVRLKTNNTLGGSYNGSTASGTADTDYSSSEDVLSVPPESGYMVFSYGHPSSVGSNRGTLVCTGSDERSLNTTNFWSSGLKFDSDSNGNGIYGATIGGSRTQISTWKNATGMKIEAIAVFAERLSAEARNKYVFPWPKVPALTVSPASGEVDWGTALTASCDDDTATIWYKIPGDEEYTKYTEPIVLNASGIKQYLIHVKGKDGNIVVADKQLTYFVGEPPKVTFTVDVPENMAVTVDGDAYIAGDELTRIVGESVTINYTVTGAYVGENQSQVVTLAADTTNIGLPPSYVAPVAAVAQIVGGNYYSTLQDAVAAITYSEETVGISLLLASSEDISLGAKITVTETSANLYTGTLSGSGTLVLAGTRSSALSFNNWTGTVVLPELSSIAGNTFNFNYYGVEGSTVRINGIGGGWLKNEVINPKIDIPAGKTLTISDFSASFAKTFKALSGAGTLSFTYNTAINTTASDWYPGYSAYYLIQDVSGFTGTLSTATPGIAIGTAKPHYQTAGGKILLTSAGARLAATASPEPETMLEGYFVKYVDGVYSLERCTATDYPVPYSWFSDYGITDAFSSPEEKAANGQNTYWESYVLGLDPTNETSKFETTITMVNGSPVVEYSPTNTTLPRLQYILQGKPTLTDDWQDVEFDDPGDTNRFFRVKVEW